MGSADSRVVVGGGGGVRLIAEKKTLFIMWFLKGMKSNLDLFSLIWIGNIENVVW
jgi:hypothetical protein